MEPEPKIRKKIEPYDYSYDAVERRQAANTTTDETEEQELERLERQAEEKRRIHEPEPDDGRY